MRIVTRENLEHKVLAQELEFACWASIGFLYSGSIHSIYDVTIDKYLNIQLCLLDDREQIIGTLTSVPISEEINAQRGWDWALQNAVPLSNAKSICGLSMSISPAYRGQGLSKLLINELKKIALKNNISRLVFPVRPTLKSKYIDTPIKEYVELGIDPWINSHLKMGGVLGEICEKSVVIEKPIGFWESWFGIKRDNSLIVPGTLTPIKLVGNKGIYEEPNIWIIHGSN